MAQLYLGDTLAAFVFVDECENPQATEAAATSWNLKAELDKDTHPAAGKVIFSFYANNPTDSFTLRTTNYSADAVATSDGAFYSLDNGDTSVVHTWDTSKDIGDDNTPPSLKMRYLIYLYKDRAKLTNFVAKSAVEVLFDINLEIGSTGFMQGSPFLRSARMAEGKTLTGTSFASCFSSCPSLLALPEIDLTKAATTGNFCKDCTNLLYAPITLPNNNAPALDLSAFEYLGADTVEYMLEHAPDLTITDTNGMLKLSSATLSRIGGSAGELATKFKAKNWYVS